MVFSSSWILILVLLTPESHTETAVCGQAPLNTRIVGGQEASPGSWPWMARLEYQGMQLCGGSLISDQWVLSAAHCFVRLPLAFLSVLLGVHSIEGSNPNEVSRTVDYMVLHPCYNMYFYTNDIALLRLVSPVPLSQYIQPICLSAADSTFNNGTKAWVMGWGEPACGGGLKESRVKMSLL